jgi:hypothetical protein
MPTRYVKKNRVHDKSSVLPAFRVLVDFANSTGNAVSALLTAFQKWMPPETENLAHDIDARAYTKDFYADAEPRPAGRLRSDIRARLRILLSGDEGELTNILTRLDEVIPPRRRTLWTEEEATSFRFVLPEIRRIKLGGKNYCAVSSYPLRRSLRELLYAMLLDSILADQICRLGQCLWCRNFTITARKKREFCRDSCRYDFNNHKPERKEYLKGGLKYGLRA